MATRLRLISVILLLPALAEAQSGPAPATGASPAPGAAAAQPAADKKRADEGKKVEEGAKAEEGKKRDDAKTLEDARLDNEQELEDAENQGNLKNELLSARCKAAASVLKAGGALDDAAKVDLESCVARDLAVQNSSDIAVDLVQTIAQVVVDKVQRQGWVALRDELRDKANCGSSDTRFSNLCAVLDTATIQDLVSSPDVLLDAAAADILQMLLTASKLHNAEAVAALEATIKGALTTLPKAYKLGPDVVVRQWQEAMFAKSRDALKTGASCDATWTSPKQTAWVAGMCFVERPNKNALADCAFDTWLASCKNTDEERQANAKLFLLTAREVFSKSNSPGSSAERVEATIRLAFGLARAEVTEGKATDEKKKPALAWLGATEDLTLGLVQHDWVRAISGATRTASLAVTEGVDCSKEATSSACTDRKEAELKLLYLLAAIGNYAATYETADASKAQADREKVLHELVDRMVSRTSKESGAKFSLGGNLGLLGGSRTASEGSQVAFPVCHSPPSWIH